MSKENHGTRAKLIAEGRKSMIINGYDGIGLNGILEAAGVPKGSFYYFFKSKEAFATAVLEAYEEHFTQMRDTLFTDPAVSPLQRVRNYFEQVEQLHRSEIELGGCLYGVLGQTARARSAAFRQSLSALFARWQMQIEQLLAQAQLAGEVHASINPAEAAAFLIEAYEGALIRMKVDGNFDAYRRFMSFAFGALHPAD